MKKALFTICAVMSMTSMGVLTYALLCCHQINALAALEVGAAGFVCLIVIVCIYIFDGEMK